MTALTRGPYQLLPPLSDDEYAALREDIRGAGVRVPIDVDEDGNILDGHHRKAIADELGVDCPERVVRGLPEFAKVDYALSVNLARRHLSAEQKKALALKSLKRDPRLSNREHARRCGVSHSYIGTLREALVVDEQIEAVKATTGKDGKAYPVDRAPQVDVTSTSSPESHREPAPGDGTDVPAGASGSGPEVAASGEEEAASSPTSSDDPRPATPPAGRGSSHDNELVDTPVGPMTKDFAVALDRLVPDPDPHAGWRISYLKRVHAVHAVMRSKPVDVAEMADAECFDELTRSVNALNAYYRDVCLALDAVLPTNVTPIRRTS